MKTNDELADLVAQGIALADRFPDTHDLADALARFTAAPDLSLGDRPHHRAGCVRPGLPVPGQRTPRRAPTVAIATPDIVGPIRNGGIGTAYTTLADALATAGHDVTILYTLGAYCENGTTDDWIEHYRARGIRFVPMPDPDGPPHIYGPRHSYAAFRWLSNRQFDVLHIPEWGGTAFCAVQAKRLGLGLAATQICVGVHSPTLWHDLEDRRTVHRIEQLETDFLERRSVEWADVVISPSQYLLQWLDRWGWTTPDRTYVQPYVSELLSRTHAFGDRVPVSEVVFFGRLESRKGLELFCDAVDRLTADTRALDYRITFLGKPGRAGDSDSLNYIRERGATWTTPWEVIADFSRQQALEYLSSRPALAVMPSVADNTPNTVLECLQAGLPFVAANTGGIQEMIRQVDHQHALVDPDPAVLARTIAERLTDGAIIVQPAADPDAVRRRWIEWHEDQVSDPPKAAAKTTGAEGPLVSVCMATHDRPAFLAQALESILEQTHQHLEVVLVDDGSETAAAKNHLQELADQFPQRGWKLLRQPRRFPGAARNAAARAARGRFILFMDDDNVALPSEIETLVQCAVSSGAPILTCAHYAFEGQVVPKNATSMRHTWLPLGGALPLAFFVNCVGDTNMLIERTAFFAIGGFDEERGAGLVEDWTFFSKALVRGMPIETVPEPLFLYRLGSHGFGQRAPSYQSYTRPLQPFIDALPNAIGLAFLYAAGAHRRSLREDVAATPFVPQAGVPVLRRTRIVDRVHTRLVKIVNPSARGADQGEHLATAFATASPLAVFAPGAGSGSAQLMPLQQVSVNSSDHVVRLDSSGDEPQLALRVPGLGVLTRGPLLIRLDLSTPRDTLAQVFWKTPRMPVYCEEQSVRSALNPGRNVRYLRIPARTIVGRLRFDPASHTGEILLHSLQIRRSE
jgi:glycosyltransferase involved in cell wall biosynthesis/GT2 family glycosyltransferase